MRRKHKLFYLVQPLSDFWWCQRKWVKSEEIQNKHASNSKICRTFDQAFKIARKVPQGEVLITQYFWKKGHRYSRCYYDSPTHP